MLTMADCYYSFLSRVRGGLNFHPVLRVIIEEVGVWEEGTFKGSLQVPYNNYYWCLYCTYCLHNPFIRMFHVLTHLFLLIGILYTSNRFYPHLTDEKLRNKVLQQHGHGHAARRWQGCSNQSGLWSQLQYCLHEIYTIEKNKETDHSHQKVRLLMNIVTLKNSRAASDFLSLLHCGGIKVVLWWLLWEWINEKETQSVLEGTESGLSLQLKLIFTDKQVY